MYNVKPILNAIIPINAAIRYFSIHKYEIPILIKDDLVRNSLLQFIL